ncbi:MAG: hypothetical protein H0W88_02040 [Parachlamydiaceae bacterium]|nr:hypothetical protein [Parachlamydiaceae bacterium]
MDTLTFSPIFNRALALTFVKKKLLMVFALLALSGLLVVFFRGLAWNAGDWVQLSLTFLPIFLCSGILISVGILLIRIYHNEIKHRSDSYRNIVSKSWEIIIGASYFAIPIILTYLLLWMLLGIFVLLKEIPLVGDFFSVILSFAPFLINLGALLLCLVSLLMLFFVTPIIALKGMDRGLVFQVVVRRLEKDPFTNMVLVLIALLPLLFILSLLILSAILTDTICMDCQTLPQIVLKWFFIMVPFTAFLTPAIVFFFNFAAEAHVLMQKKNTVVT